MNEQQTQHEQPAIETPNEIAHLLSAVLNHPETPRDIYHALEDNLNIIHPKFAKDSPEGVAFALDFYAETDAKDRRREAGKEPEISREAAIELSQHLTAVLDHPETPVDIFNQVADLICDVQMFGKLMGGLPPAAAKPKANQRKDVTSFRPNASWENLRNVTEDIVFLVSGFNVLVVESGVEQQDAAVEMILIMLDCLTMDGSNGVEDNIGALRSYLYTLTSNFESAEENFRARVKSEYLARVEAHQDCKDEQTSVDQTDDAQTAAETPGEVITGDGKDVGSNLIDLSNRRNKAVDGWLEGQ